MFRLARAPFEGTHSEVYCDVYLGDAKLMPPLVDVPHCKVSAIIKAGRKGIITSLLFAVCPQSRNPILQATSTTNMGLPKASRCPVLGNQLSLCQRDG